LSLLRVRVLLQLIFGTLATCIGPICANMEGVGRIIVCDWFSLFNAEVVLVCDAGCYLR
jgi:hypothetical protein